jgi:hypothetical protein
VAFFNYYFNRKNNEKALHRNCSDITEVVENQQNYNNKRVLRSILDCLPTDFAVFDTNHKYLYLNPVAIKELREYIIGRMILNMLHTDRTDNFAIETH